MKLPKTASPAERQHRYIFIYATVSYIIGILCSFFSEILPETLFYKTINTIHLGVLMLLLTLFLFSKVTTEKLLILFLGITQTEIAIEMLYGVVGKHPTESLIILENMELLALLLMLSIVSYFRIIP